jgi:cytochrome c biogenesis protein CcdA
MTMETLLNHLAQSLTDNPFLAYIGVFLGGVLSSSSPCVLATIPLVIGYVGGYSEGNRRKALVYSLVFILGLSITFTALGAIASIVGGLFGIISRTWYYIVGGIAVVIGLHLIGLFQWSLPVPVHFQPKRRGILGAFFLGLFFGVISSPCATPVLALILTFVATKGEVVYGTSLLFIYALGHCALIFLAGTATGFVESFVKSKGISNVTFWGKRIGGSIVVLVGIYLVYTGITL